MAESTTGNNDWAIHHDTFKSILGESPTKSLLLHMEDYPFAHEAGIYIADRDELFITSNQFSDPKTGEKKVQISKISLGKDRSAGIKLEVINCDEPILMANGGVNYENDEFMLICSQGGIIKPSGLYKLGTTPPYTAELLIADFQGRPFNAVNDVVVHPEDKTIWFTDPSYGFYQGYRPRPKLPNQVYRYNPETKAIRAMADGMGMPNGLCFSPDLKTLYVTDTDQIRGEWVDYSRAGSIYAFDIITRGNQPFLANKRLFAFVDNGVPDGIKCDMDGNVYSGCGDGIQVWSEGGDLLGKLLIEGGAANFCFGRDGEIFGLNEHKLWRFQLNKAVKGALLGI